MILDLAVQRVNRGLGFLPVGHGQTNDIIQCFDEAQRDLEKGKTLPRFLLREDQPLLLPTGEHKIALPTDFLRPDDDNPLSYVAPDSNLVHYLYHSRSYREAVAAIQSTQRPDQPQQGTDVPMVYVLRGPDIAMAALVGTIDFITIANVDYNLTWNYYGNGGQLVDTGTENLWLKHAPEWLIGEAGLRMAIDKRDKGAVELFTKMMREGRMAAYADDRAFEDAGGPLIMGGNL